MSTVRRTQYLFILVISPLVALMRDHGALRLKKQNIAAAYEAAEKVAEVLKGVENGNSMFTRLLSQCFQWRGGKECFLLTRTSRVL